MTLLYYLVLYGCFSMTFQRRHTWAWCLACCVLILATADDGIGWFGAGMWFAITLEQCRAMLYQHSLRKKGRRIW